MGNGEATMDEESETKNLPGPSTVEDMYTGWPGSICHR